ncbi:MAG TPA: exodeoxyribonuclease VII small subunit [Gaiellaceae bacterium]
MSELPDGANEQEARRPFEESQAELEQIVARLERGDVELEELAALWERGEELYRRCAAQLAEAHGRIEELARRLDGNPAEPPE